MLSRLCQKTADKTDEKEKYIKVLYRKLLPHCSSVSKFRKVSKSIAISVGPCCTIMTEKSVLSSTLSGGPHGLGDPDDRSLRKVEVEVLIPKLMREKAKSEKCIPEVAEFEKCCKDSALLMVVKCRAQNSALKDCLSHWYKDDHFREICTEEYLKERSEYRRTGIKKPIKRA